jgi:hypothetical protein
VDILKKSLDGGEPGLKELDSGTISNVVNLLLVEEKQSRGDGTGGPGKRWIGTNHGIEDDEMHGRNLLPCRRELLRWCSWSPSSTSELADTFGNNTVRARLNAATPNLGKVHVRSGKSINSVNPVHQK